MDLNDIFGGNNNKLDSVSNDKSKQDKEVNEELFVGVRTKGKNKITFLKGIILKVNDEDGLVTKKIVKDALSEFSKANGCRGFIETLEEEDDDNNIITFATLCWSGDKKKQLYEFLKSKSEDKNTTLKINYESLKLF